MKTDGIIMAFGSNRTLVKLYNFFGDGKSQSGTAVSGGSGTVQAEKLFKNPLQFFLRDGRTLVFHNKRQLRFIVGDMNQD